MKTTGKKGTTLVELSVVLALVAIISVMVVSFSILFSQRIASNSARLDVMGELEMVENVTEGWLGQMKLLDAQLSVDGNGLQAVVPGTGTPYTLSFNGQSHVLCGTMPGGGEMTCSVGRVQSVEFSSCGDATDPLFFYTLTYSLSVTEGDQEQYTQIFCVNPRVGEVHAGAPEEETEEGETSGDENPDEGGAVE